MVNDRVKNLAYTYASNKHESQVRASYKGYLSGYDQCIKDGNPDLDEWQQRLSDDYSSLKEKYLYFKAHSKRLKQILLLIRNGVLKPEDISPKHFV